MRAMLALLAFVLMGCAQPAAQPEPLEGPRFDPPFALPEPPCPVPELPDEAGVCRPAAEAVVGEGGRVFWVDQRHPEASDTNPGTAERPWRTIERATGVRTLRPGDAVLVRAGLYRESVLPRAGGTGPGRRVTYAAYPGDIVVVTGADPLPGDWREEAGAWRHPWTRSLPAYAGYLGTVMRRELVVADGTVLRPVFERDSLGPGTFYVEGPDTAPVALHVRFEDDAPAESVWTEVGERARLFFPLAPEGAEPSCGDPRQPGWFRLVGFTFRHAANRAQWGAVCAGGTHALVEDVTVEWTNGAGFDTSGEAHLFRRNRALDNGQIGFVGSCTDCRFERNEAARNNWKGYDPFWEAGGGKWVRTDGSVFVQHVAYDNDGPGLWLDYENADNVIEGGYFFRNAGAGIMLELETTGTLVAGNVAVATRWWAWSGSGILSQAASGNTYAHNTLAFNEGNGLWLRLDPERRGADGGNVVLNNLIVHNATTTEGEAREVAVEGETTAHLETNRFAGNVYGRQPERWDRSTFFVRPEPGNPAHYRGGDPDRWRTLTGAREDRLAPAGGGVLEAASGWRLLPDARMSPVPLPAEVASRMSSVPSVVGAGVGERDR